MPNPARLRYKSGGGLSLYTMQFLQVTNTEGRLVAINPREIIAIGKTGNSKCVTEIALTNGDNVEADAALPNVIEQANRALVGAYIANASGSPTVEALVNIVAIVERFMARSAVAKYSAELVTVLDAARCEIHMAGYDRQLIEARAREATR